MIFLLNAVAFRSVWEKEYREELMKGFSQEIVAEAKRVNTRMNFIIKYPTRINAGAVAADGISRKTGEKSRAKRNSTETIIEERPVHP